MCRQRFYICKLVIFCLFARNCSSQPPPVVISTGAFITPMESVVIYNDVELIHHFIGDLPNPPASIAQPCAPGATKKSCAMSTHLSSMVQDSTLLLQILNKARTTYGLKPENLPQVYVQENRFQTVPEDVVKVDPPATDLVKVVGQSWYDKVKDRLVIRKLYLNGTEVDGHRMVRRWIQYLKPLVIGGAALLGVDDLLDYAESLFVGENGILRFLTTLHAVSPEKSLVDITNRVSEFEAKTRRVIGEIALDTAELKRVTDDLQVDVSQNKMDLATIEDSQLASQQIMGDLASIMFTQMIYFAYMHADANCRSGYLSPLLVPPKLLAAKLTDAAKNLPTDMRLAITLDEIQKYYTRKSVGCLYDSHGGIITIQVPLVFKNADYKLYELRGLFFAWGDSTCTLDSASRYVVKDLRNGHVYPVEEVDAERCSPHILKKCRVPPASDSSEAYCLNMLLSSSTVAQIRDACKISCFKKNATLFTEMQPNIYVGVHIPEKSLQIHCRHHDIYNVSDKVEYGSIRITTPCACDFKINQKTVGRSSGPLCEGHESIRTDVLLPAHWTTLSDLLPFTHDGGQHVTKFEHMMEIFNPNAMDVADLEVSWIPAELSVLSFLWNFAHSFAIAYILFRINVGTASTAIHLSSYHSVEAAQVHNCKLNDDLFYMLCAIITLCSLAFIPPIFGRFYSFLRRQFWEAVEVAADTRLATI